MLKPGLIPAVAVPFIMVVTGQNAIASIVVGLLIWAAMTGLNYVLASRKV